MKKNKLYLLISVIILGWISIFTSSCQKHDMFQNALSSIRLINSGKTLWEYEVKSDNYIQKVAPPIFEIDGKQVIGIFQDYHVEMKKLEKISVIEYLVSGKLQDNPLVTMKLILRISDNNPVVRFRYKLSSAYPISLTKNNDKDQIKYLGTSVSKMKHIKEISLSEFFELEHTYLPRETEIQEKDFENQLSFMGPIFIAQNDRHALLISYEHGSQVPDRFIQFECENDKSIILSAVKGNYYNHQKLNNKDGFSTIWMNLEVIAGDLDQLAKYHRNHLLNFVSENMESRKPYIFYNTWNYQERNKWWNGQQYLSSMNEDRILQEIEIAHQMGIEVFVIDTGWFSKTGDWKVSSKRFPDKLKEVKAKLDRYGMKLGLWFNADAARSSNMLKRNKNYILNTEGKEPMAHKVWETEESYTMCLVSPFANDYANELIRISKKYGVKYFKWDAFSQYGCNAAGHWHGTRKNTPEERAECYSFQLPLAMIRIVNKICREIPDAIVDFDITEGERPFGLAFLEAGKFFTVNNGPYYSSFDDPVYAPGGGMGANVLVFPGLARAANARTVTCFDKWIPSILLLTHYLPDDPEYSQWINLGSLILGGNGIWGDLLNITEEGIERINTTLSKYKQVREDITNSFPFVTGETGGIPEIHEKINYETGKGVVVMFYNYKRDLWNNNPSFPGTFTYVTHAKVNQDTWTNKGVNVSFDKAGRAIITGSFQEAGAKIIFFGTK